MTARDLLLSADQVTVLKCDEVVKCMNPGPVTVADCKGLAQTISERLILLHPALHTRQPLTPSDQKFLSILTVEFLTYLEKTPPGLATHNIELFSKVIANEVISSSIKSFIVRLKHWMGTNALTNKWPISIQAQQSHGRPGSTNGGDDGRDCLGPTTVGKQSRYDALP